MTAAQFPLTPSDAGEGPIDFAEDRLVAECERVVGSVFKSIEGGPGKWSDEYLLRLIKTVPAIRVAFLGGPARDANDLDLDSRWAVYVATGWGKGQREADRRRGEKGAWRAVQMLAPWLHNNNTLSGDGVGQVRVERVSNLWSGVIDRKGLTLLSIMLQVPLHFEVPVDCDRFDEFIHAGFSLEPGPADPARTEADRIRSDFDVRQPETEGA